MYQLATKLYSFEEYINHKDLDNNKDELLNGELIIMLPASRFHALIMVFIYVILTTEIKRLQQQ